LRLLLLLLLLRLLLLRLLPPRFLFLLIRPGRYAERLPPMHLLCCAALPPLPPACAACALPLAYYALCARPCCPCLLLLLLSTSRPCMCCSFEFCVFNSAATHPLFPQNCGATRHGGSDTYHLWALIGSASVFRYRCWFCKYCWCWCCRCWCWYCCLAS